MDKYPPGPICRTIHKIAEIARKCMAHIPGPNFIGYKPELMADDWHPVPAPPQPEPSRNKGKGKRIAATQLKPYWRTNYPIYSVWNEGTPATSIPSLVKEFSKTTKRPRSASQSSFSIFKQCAAVKAVEVVEVKRCRHKIKLCDSVLDCS